MNIKELASKYELTENDFWELRKNSGKWIITHDACEKIAVTEGIVFDPPEIISYTPTIITGNKQYNPDYKIWTTGEANGDNCSMNYMLAMGEKRGKDRIILKLINAYEYGIYSDVEADDFGKREKVPTEKQLEKLHNLADDLGYKLIGIDKMNREDVSQKIDELQSEIQNRESTEHAIKQEQLIKES